MPRKHREPRPQISIAIDITGVRANSKVADLTVGQFVELLVQVSQQLTAHRLKISPKQLQSMISNIRQVQHLARRAKRGAAVEQTVTSMQNAMLDRLPQIMEATLRR